MNFHIYSPGFAPDEGEYYEWVACKQHLCEFFNVTENDAMFIALSVTPSSRFKRGSYYISRSSQPCEECAE